MAKIRAYAREQMNYIEAKTTYDKLYTLSGERQEAILATWSGNLEGEDLENYAEIAGRIEREIGLWQASEVVQKAEDVLIAWGKAKLATHAEYAQFDDVFEAKFVSARQKLCNLLLRL